MLTSSPRAIDAALGIDVGVDGAGRIAALDAAVGQIEGVERQIEEGIFAGALLGDQNGRCRAAFAFGEGGVELGVAAGVGLGGRQHFVVAGDELDGRIGNGRRLAQRAHEARARRHRRRRR